MYRGRPGGSSFRTVLHSPVLVTCGIYEIYFTNLRSIKRYCFVYIGILRCLHRDIALSNSGHCDDYIEILKFLFHGSSREFFEGFSRNVPVKTKCSITLNSWLLTWILKPNIGITAPVSGSSQCNSKVFVPIASHWISTGTGISAQKVCVNPVLGTDYSDCRF